MKIQAAAQVSPPNIEVSLVKEELRGLFMRYDENGDKVLSRPELKKAFKELRAMFPLFRACQALHEADANADGVVSMDEMDGLVDFAYQLGFKVISK